MSKTSSSHLIEIASSNPRRNFPKKRASKHGAVSRDVGGVGSSGPTNSGRARRPELVWNKKWLKVLDWQEPFAKWFVGGKLNVAENCLDRISARRAETRRRSFGKASRVSAA